MEKTSDWFGAADFSFWEQRGTVLRWIAPSFGHGHERPPNTAGKNRTHSVRMNFNAENEFSYDSRDKYMFILDAFATTTLHPSFANLPTNNFSKENVPIPASNAVHLRQAPKAVERLLSAYLSVLHAKLAPMYEPFHIVEELLFLLDTKSPFTGAHSRRVATAARQIAISYGLKEAAIERVSLAALLHDVGKLVTPNEILEKRSALTAAERKCIQTHAMFTNVILAAFPIFDAIRNTASLHHEHLNGTGYPFGFSGKQLSAEARIITVADIFVALTEERPYRSGLSTSVSLSKLLSLAEEGILDADVVTSATDILLFWKPSAPMWKPSFRQVNVALTVLQ